jgi:hypothetical protein
MCGKQRTLSPLFLDVWQVKELRSDFSDVWQRKRLEEEQLRVEVESREEQRFRARPSEDELRHTRRRVAGITRRVNYFIGTVRTRCGKSVAKAMPNDPGKA